MAEQIGLKRTFNAAASFLVNHHRKKAKDAFYARLFQYWSTPEDNAMFEKLGQAIKEDSAGNRDAYLYIRGKADRLPDNITEETARIIIQNAEMLATVMLRYSDPPSKLAALLPAETRTPGYAQAFEAYNAPTLAKLARIAPKPY